MYTKYKCPCLLPPQVKESFNKPPTFVTGPGSVIELSETYTDFRTPVATYTARSNIPGDSTVFFQLVRGRTEQTNKDDTFRALQTPDRPNAVDIHLAKPLQYERVAEYTLTLQVSGFVLRPTQKFWSC